MNFAKRLIEPTSKSSLAIKVIQVQFIIHITEAVKSFFGHSKQFKEVMEAKPEEPKTKPLIEDLQFVADCYKVFFRTNVNDSWRGIFREFFKQLKFHFKDKRFLLVRRSDFISMAERQGILEFTREEDKTGRMKSFKSRTLFNCSLGYVYDFTRTVPSVTLKNGISEGNLMFQVNQAVIDRGGRKLVTVHQETPEEITARTIFSALWGLVTEPRRNVIGTPMELVTTSATKDSAPDCRYVMSNETYVGASKYVVPEDSIMIGRDLEKKKEIKFTPTPFGYIIWLSPDADSGMVEKVGWLYSKGV